MKRKISSDWKIKDGTYSLDFSIQANSLAEVLIKSKKNTPIVEDGKEKKRKEKE